MTATRKIRWGILGTKWISGVMAEALQQSKTAQLLAIGSRDMNRAIEFSKKYNVPKSYNNYSELLLDEEIDVVYIGLPNHLHKEWIIRCAQAGKHILCEKPFVLNAEEAREALDAAKKHRVFCMEALMYRCHPFISHLEKLFANKIIGEIQHIAATYNVNISAEANQTAGGAIRSLGCYPASLVRIIMKDEPIKILGMGKVNGKNKNDCSAAALCIFKNNITASISTSNSMDWHWQFTVYGTKGTLDVSTNPWLPDRLNKFSIKTADKTDVIEFKADQNLYTYQIDCVGEHILQKLPSPKDPGVTWDHTLGNINFLESWRSQVGAVLLNGEIS